MKEIRVIVTDHNDSIYEIWQIEPRVRKDGTSLSITTAITWAIQVKPDGGKITIETIEVEDG